MTTHPPGVVSRLWLHNFRSVRAIDVDLSNFTCLIGPNNSGKTNILDGLVFLSDVAREGLNKAASSRGGSHVLRYFGADSQEPTVIGIELSHRGQPTFRYELVLDSKLFVRGEKLTRLDSNNGFNLLQTSPRGDRAETILARADGQASDKIGTSQRQEIVAHWMDLDQAHADTRKFFSDLASWRGYRFLPDRLKSTGQATEAKELAPDGSNFASYFHTIHSRHRRAFEHIEEQLIHSFPEVEELSSPLVGSQTVVGVKERWFERHAEGKQLSDGLVGYLAHLVAVHAPHSPRLLIFEEPENYIHSRLMERLVALMRKTSSSTQTIITTHSVTLLNLLQLSDIRIVDKEDGATTIRPPQTTDDLARAVRDLGLGDAYFSGALGGIPG